MLILLVLFGGYGYSWGWHRETPDVLQLFGLLLGIIIILSVLRLLGQL